MIRLAVPIVILLLMLFGGAVWMLNAYLDLPDSTPTVEKSRPASAKETTARDADRTDLTDTPAAPIDDAKGSFDVARIDPNGTSVFAGRAAPGAAVTIMGDGQALGTAQADENGEWTFATEHQFASADPKLALVVKSPAEAAKEAADRTKVAAAEQRETVPAKGTAGAAVGEGRHQEPHEEPGRDGRGRAHGAASRRAAGSRAAGERPRQRAGHAACAERRVAAADRRCRRLPPPTDPAQQKTVVPVPITFVFNEATFTDDGKKAAGLLLEYLRLKHFGKVSLTGHADERGTDELNMRPFARSARYGGALSERRRLQGRARARAQRQSGALHRRRAQPVRTR